MSDLPRVENLPTWPIYETPYIVEDAFGTYIETFATGADADAFLMDVGSVRPAHGSMRVVEESWNESFTERRILCVAMICPRGDWFAAR